MTLFRRPQRRTGTLVHSFVATPDTVCPVPLDKLVRVWWDNEPNGQGMVTYAKNIRWSKVGTFPHIVKYGVIV
jgi:hypothetical protein